MGLQDWVASLLGRSAQAADPEIMKVVVGLGNPGRRYQGTRHNVGFEVIARLMDRFGLGSTKSRFHGQATTLRCDGGPFLLLMPETYMNRSGQAVQAALAFYKLEPQSVLVLCDDLSLPTGKIRMRARGSDGGHKGLRSVAQQLGTDRYPRLRIGIGSAPDGWETSDYVLSRFRADEREPVDRAVKAAAEAVLCWGEAGAEACMNKYN